MTTTQNTCGECNAPIPSPTYVWERWTTKFILCVPCANAMEEAEEAMAEGRYNSEDEEI